MWLNLCFGGFFALYSGGDWMKAFRWFNLTSVPLFVLLAAGLGSLADALIDPDADVERPDVPAGFWGASGRRALLFAAPVLALGTLAIMKTVDFAYGPETATTQPLQQEQRR